MEKVYSRIKLNESNGLASSPLVVNPSDDKDYNILLGEENVSLIRQRLLSVGAVLIRGFEGLTTVESFQQVYKAICGEMLEYRFQTSPRSRVGSKVYTSTDHPSSQHIHMHTESSYSRSWPRYIGFFCLKPSSSGGQTPIAREGDIIKCINPEALEKFRNSGVKYVRNFTKGLGLSWQKAYQVDDKEQVEKILKDKKMEFEWINDNHLRVEWVLPAFQPHPETKESLWFNHMYFGHKSLYDPKVLQVVPEDYLPFLTFYGDGSPVEREVIDRLKCGYSDQEYRVNWQQGDLLLLENMIFSHGRYPYEGDRKILVGMAEEVRV